MAPLSAVKVEPVRGRVSEEEWKVRVDLAACYRLVALNGWDDVIYTHHSARVPGDENHFLINPFGLKFNEITASSLLKLDVEGNKLLESPYDRLLQGFVIHSAVHMGHPDAHCVMHTHTPAGTAVAAQKNGLLPVSQKALRFYNRIGYHDYEGLADDLEERERIVKALGSNSALILRTHGLLTIGKTVASAFETMGFLEDACETQLLAQSGGAELIMPSPAICEHTAAQYCSDDLTNVEMEWDAHLRMLDRIDPSFRD